MEKLQKLVEKLEKEFNEREQIKILQEINSLLLTDYEIRIGDDIIEPLLVEAYYFHKGKFEDTSVHACKHESSKAKTYELADERQADKLGELYVHYGTKDGIDIVLSQKGNYYLSFLIKTALVNGECAKQCAISEKICGNCDRHSNCKGFNCKHYDKVVLEPIDSKNSEIVFTLRKGIKNNFANKPLAALSINAFKNKSVADAIVGSLEKEHKKQWVLAKYALENADLDIEKARDLIKQKELYQSRIEDKYFESALKYIREQEN